MTMPDSVQRSRFSATQSQFKRLTPSKDQESDDDLQTPPEPGHVAQALWHASNAYLPFVPRAAHAFSRDVQSRNKDEFGPRARAIGSRVLGNQLSAILKYLRELWTAPRD